MTPELHFLRCLTMMILLSHHALLYAESVQVMVETTDKGARLILGFGSPPDFQVQSENHTWVLKFSRPLKTRDLTPIARRLEPWVNSLWSSYDALSLTLRPDAEIEIQAQGERLMIDFRKIMKPIRTTPDQNYLLDRARGLLLLETGQVWQARDHFHALAEYHPGITQAWMDLAGTEERTGRWRQALSAYEQALILEPDSKNAQSAYRRLRDAYGNTVKLGLAGLEVGDDESYRIVSLAARLLNTKRGLMALDYRLLDADLDLAVRRPSGQVKNYTGRRHDLALHYEQSWKRHQQRISLFAGAAEPGLGWKATGFGDRRRTLLAVEFRRPWYQALEAIAAGGSRDRILLQHIRYWLQGLEVQISASGNRYAIGEESSAARSLRARFRLRHHFTRWTNWSLGYAFDGERVSDYALAMDSDKNSFRILPLENRSQHTMNVSWGKYIPNKFTLSLQAGFEYDRGRDASAPFGRLDLSGNTWTNLRAGLEMYSGLSSYRGEEKQYGYLGTYLRGVF